MNKIEPRTTFQNTAAQAQGFVEWQTRFAPDAFRSIFYLNKAQALPVAGVVPGAFVAMFSVALLVEKVAERVFYNMCYGAKAAVGYKQQPTDHFDKNWKAIKGSVGVAANSVTNIVTLGALNCLAKQGRKMEKEEKEERKQEATRQKLNSKSGKLDRDSNSSMADFDASGKWNPEVDGDALERTIFGDNWGYTLGQSEDFSVSHSYYTKSGVSNKAVDALLEAHASHDSTFPVTPEEE